jgi:hypothetical protein
MNYVGAQPANEFDAFMDEFAMQSINVDPERAYENAGLTRQLVYLFAHRRDHRNHD